MSQLVENQPVVDWNLRKAGWNLHPKMWETELWRQRMSVALMVISTVGAVAAGLMASGVVGSFSAVAVTATGIAAIVAFVAGRRFGSCGLGFWDDPAFRVKKGKAALQDLEDGNIGVFDFQRKYTELFNRQIIGIQDIKLLIESAYAKCKDPHLFIQRYGKDGIKLLSGKKKQEFISALQLKNDPAQLDGLLQNDLNRLTPDNPETYQTLREDWGLNIISLLSEGARKKCVAPVAKAYFATQEFQGFKGYIEKFLKECHLLQIDPKEEALPIIAKEIDLLVKSEDNIDFEMFKLRNIFVFQDFDFRCRDLYSLMNEKQKKVVIPKFIEYALSSSYSSDNFEMKCIRLKVHTEGLDLTKEIFAKQLVDKVMKGDQTLTLQQLVDQYGLQPDFVTDEKRESLKDAFYRMDPKEWNSKRYHSYREKLDISLDEMKAKLKAQIEESKKTGLLVSATSIPHWY